MRSPIAPLLAVLIGVAACASTPGARPEDMSAAGHDAAAAREEARVAWAADPGEAQRLRKMAADHRAASATVRDAEASACANLSEADRAMSPFEHYRDIASVEPIYVGARYRHLVGATIRFRAVPGLTAQWLRRLIDCHSARIAALGHDVPEMPDCPLVPKDVTVTVTTNDAGFDVELKSWNDMAAHDVWRRAQDLVHRHAAAPTTSAR